jgi:hypothetical protein
LDIYAFKEKGYRLIFTSKSCQYDYPLLFIELTFYTLQIYMKCPCCGGEMIKEKESEKTINLKCNDCGLSNTELKG